MKKIVLTAVLVLLSPVVLAAGPVIRETDTEIIVEYSGTPDQKPAVEELPLAEESPGEPAPPAEEPAVTASPGGETGTAPAPRRERRGRRGGSRENVPGE